MTTNFGGDTPDGPRDRIPARLSKIEFARRLKKHLDRKGWRQSELARRADVTRDAVSTYARASSLPSKVNLDKIARALGVPPEELLPNVIQDGLDMQTPPYSLMAHGTDGNLAWLTVNRLVEAKTGQAVIALLMEDKAVEE